MDGIMALGLISGMIDEQAGRKFHFELRRFRTTSLLTLGASGRCRRQARRERRHERVACLVQGQGHTPAPSCARK